MATDDVQEPTLEIVVANFSETPNLPGEEAESGEQKQINPGLDVEGSGPESNDPSQSKAMKQLGGNQTAEKGGTFWGTVFNLFNNMLGSGILAMADGTRFGSFLGVFIVYIVVGWMQLKTMALMGGVCKQHKAASFRQLWEAVVGTRGAWMIDVFIGLNSWFACISYCMLVTQYFTLSLTELLRGTVYEVYVSTKAVNMAAIGIFVLLPVALFKSLHQLKCASFLGLGCVCFAMIFLNIDTAYWSSTRIASRECYPLKDDGGCTSWEVFRSSFAYLHGGIVNTINICVSSLMCHYNIPRFYSELKSDDPKEFTKIVYWAGFFGLSTYFAFAYSGFLRFGTGMPRGNVFAHYKMDELPEFERIALLFAYLAMSVSLMFTMPLLFNAFRVSLMQLVGSNMSYFDGRETQYRVFTAILISILCVLGVVAPDLTLITRLKGCICGMSVSVFLPAVIFWKTNSITHTSLTRLFTFGLGLFGATLATYGLIQTFIDYI